MKKILPTLQALFARAKFWRRAASSPDTSTEDAAANDMPPAAALDLPPRSSPPLDLPPADLPPGDHLPLSESDDSPPKPPLAKRILAILIRKSVWVPAVALLLIALTVTATVGILRAQQKDGDKALQTLQAEKSKLEAENRKLREAASRPRTPAGPAILPAPAKTAQTAQRTSPPPDPAFDVPSAAPKTARATGDCLITGKEAGESLKRCIEAFNQFEKH